MTKHILIAGCGKLGAAVGEQLVQAGHRVTGLRRSDVIDTQGIDYLQADLSEPGTLRVVPTDIDLLIIIVTPSDYSDAGYRAIYLEAVANLLMYFSGQGILPPVIYVSSTRVYGQSQGEWVDEESEIRPADEKGRILLEAEQQVLACGGAKNTVVRFSGIYDAGSQFMQRLVKQGNPIQFDPPVFTNRVHREDCVRALVFLVQKQLADEVLETHYLVSDDEPAAKWDVINWLAQSMGLPSPEKAICEAEAGQGKRCRNKRIRNAGFSFKYPTYREGYDQ